MRAAAVLIALAAAGAPGVPQASVRRDVSYYHYCMARQALDRSDVKQAIEHMEQAREADPESLELALDLARLHLETGDPDRAAEAARAAARMDPSSPGPGRVLAEALFAAALRDGSGPDAYKRSAQAFEELLKADPGNTSTLLDLGRLHMSRGAFEEALDPLGRLMEKDPGSEEGAMLTAQALSRLKRFDQARQLLLNAVQAAPHRVHLRLALIEAYEAEGDLGAAAATASRLLEMGYEPARMHFALARLYAKMERPSDAYEHLAVLSGMMEERAADFAVSDRAEIQLRMIGALLDAGRGGAAAQAAASARQLFPEDERFLLRQGEALLLEGRDREAEELFDRFAEGKGGSPRPARLSEVYLAAGARRERAGDVKAARRHLEQAIALDPGNAVALNYLGYMLAERGERLDDAIRYIRRALERDPDNGAYLDSLGWAYFRKGDYGRAETSLQEARRAMDDEPAIHEHLGELYFATGRPREAIEAWQAALERGAGNAEHIRSRLEAARSAAGSKD
ncbi:MAG TPA: tetratricopeptide repeat protein [Candidatus Polarisedimenticolia bacterium]|nr:tetratricopeptide repeat protein [Candidatus Polarisedimenticolia bacterium]